MKKYFLFCLIIVLLFVVKNVAAEQTHLGLNGDFNIQTDFKFETNNKFVWQGNITEDDNNIFGITKEILVIPQDLKQRLSNSGIIKVGNSVLIIGSSENGIRIAKEVKLITQPQKEINNDSQNDLISAIRIFLQKKSIDPR